MTVFAFEPPVFFLHHARGLIVKHDVLEKTLDLGYQEGEVRHARRLDEIAFEASIAVRGELLRVDAYFEWDRTLPDQPAKERGGRRRRGESRWRVAYATKGRHRGR